MGCSVNNKINNLSIGSKNYYIMAITTEHIRIVRYVPRKANRGF